MKKAYSYIRFSTPDQLKGDSLRRQLEATRQYCKQNNLILDESLNFKDLGLSAFHGAHKAKGALKQLLELVANGTIEPGSILIVENLDRLSREQVLDALNQFTNIIKAGIKIVTLMDGQQYDQQSINDNWAQLIISITYMARAHDESLRKSQRLKSAWSHKRKQAQTGKIITKIAPMWLKVNDDKTGFEVIEPAAQAINLIYKMRLKGIGPGSIVRSLNQNPNVWKPAKGKRNKTGGWHLTYVRKILISRAVIGEFTPQMRGEPGQKRIDMQPIADYFPAIVDKSLFYAVQNEISKNSNQAGHGGGMVNKGNNVFAGLLQCGKCGGTMHYISKGGNKYVQCDRSRRKLTNEKGHRQCSAKLVRYDSLFDVVFNDIEGFNINELTNTPTDQQRQKMELKTSLQATEQLINEIERKQKNIIDQIADENDKGLRNALSIRHKQFEDQLQQAGKRQKQLKTELTKLQGNGKQLLKEFSDAKDLRQLIDTATDEQKAIELRLHLRAIVRRIIKRIRVNPSDKGRFKEREQVEPGLWVLRKNRYMDKVTIYYNGTTKTVKSILPLKFYHQVGE